RIELWREHLADLRLAIRPRHRHSARRVREVRQVEAKLPASVNVHELAQLVGEARFTVRRESHHLELVAVLRESKKLGDRQVQQPERMWKEDAILYREARTTRDA